MSYQKGRHSEMRRGVVELGYDGFTIFEDFDNEFGNVFIIGYFNNIL